MSGVIGFCSTLNTDELDWSRVLIYPNPSSGRFEISNSSGKPIEAISVFDMSGRMVESQTISETGSFKWTFPTSHPACILSGSVQVPEIDILR
ncbi:MAG: T9SS type A sorting domain-containing protein [Bacteroidetes bacterium]|nr:T9SS type A sorting domain-containing protein [Bacteroidota bacterium]